MCLVEGNWALWGPKSSIQQTAAGEKIQDTRYRIQDTAYTYKHTGVEGYEGASIQGHIGCRMQDRRTPLSLVAPLKRGWRILPFPPMGHPSHSVVFFMVVRLQQPAVNFGAESYR